MKTFLIILFLSIAKVSLCQEPRLVLPIGHTEPVTSGYFSFDNKLVVTSSPDRTVRLWDIATGKMLRKIEFKEDSTLKVSYVVQVEKGTQIGYGAFQRATDTPKVIRSHNGKMAFIFNGSKGANIFVDANNLELLHRLKSDKKITRAIFSNDDSRLVTKDIKDSIKLWDTATGKLIAAVTWEYKKFENPFHFSADGKLLYIKDSYTSSHYSYDAVSGKDYRIFAGDVLRIDSQTILSAEGGGFYITDLSTGKKSTIFTVETGTANTISKDLSKAVIIPKTSYLSKKKPAEVWDISTKTKLLSLEKDVYDRFDFTEDNKFLLATTEKKELMWDIATGMLIKSTERIAANVAPEVKRPNEQVSDLVKYAVFMNADSTLCLFSGTQQIKVVELRSPFKEVVLAGIAFNVRSACYSNDGQYIAVGSGDGTTKIWSVDHSVLQQSVSNGAAVVQVNFSTNDNQIRTLGRDGFSRIIDWKNNKILQTLAVKDILGDTLAVQKCIYSRNGKRALVLTGSQKIFDVEANKAIASIGRFGMYVYCADFTPNGKKIYACSSSAGQNHIKLVIFDTETGKLDTIVNKYNDDSINSLSFDPTGKFLLTTWTKNLVALINPNTGEIITKFIGHKMTPFYAEFDHDANRILSVGRDQTVKIWDVKTGKLLKNIVYETAQISAAHFSPDGKNILITANDYTVSIWNVEKEQRIATFFSLGEAGYVTILPNGYYQASTDAAKQLHYVTHDLKIINFEQLDVKYNRPDKVLEAIGSKDKALIDAYKKAYEKRIKKLGIDTLSFQEGYTIPEADFQDRQRIEFEQRNGTIRLHIKGMDNKTKLDRMNIWINETPIFGLNGISLKKKKINSIDTVIEVNLSTGRNAIETSITNVGGIESYRKPLIVNYQSDKVVKPKLWFIGLGIEKFSDSNFDLKWSEKDVKNLEAALKQRNPRNFRSRILLNTDLTKEKVVALKKWLLDSTTINDQVVISYSGHGLLSKNFDYFLSTYDVDFNRPEMRGLSYDALENLLDAIPARQKLLLIDACHSGELDKETYQDMINQQQETLPAQPIKNGKGNLGVIIKNTGVGLKNSFELMQQLFNNVGRSTGATVISAAGGMEFAFENGDLKGGVFTFSLLEKLKQLQFVKISHLKNHVYERVNFLTKGLQKPTTRSELQDYDWEL